MGSGIRVLICLSLVTSDVERRFLCLLAFVHLLQEMTIQILCSVFNLLPCLCLVKDLYTFLVLSPLSDICFADIFSHSGAVFFHSLDGVF